MDHRAIALAALGVFMGAGAASAQPSFDCRKAATPTEKAICADDHLARLDRTIAAAFRQLRAELASQVETLPGEQTEFLKVRDACQGDKACLARTMESRRSALALQPQRGVSDRRERFVGRYRNQLGFAIVRRRLDGGYELIVATGHPSGRWVCDVFAPIREVNKDNVAVAEAGEENESYPVHLAMKGSNLVISEERPLAGYLCGHNGGIEGTYSARGQGAVRMQPGLRASDVTWGARLVVRLGHPARADTP